MDLQLKDKTAFVTGSTGGIGWGIANALAAEGCHVVLHGRTEESVITAVASLNKSFPEIQCQGLAADLQDAEQTAALISKLPEVDILINNAGIFTSQQFEETTDADWYRLMEVNIMAGVRLSRTCLPMMMRKNWGRILFVSSECAQLVPPDLIAYSTTKAAVHAVSRGLAQVTKGTGVTVNTILPGSTLSEGAQRFLVQTAEKEHITPDEVASRFFKEVRTTSLLQRFADTGEVARTVVFYCSPLASITNGAVIRVDGGAVPGIF